jgi:hypothetical protein
LRTKSVHRIPPNVRDDGQRPSYRDETGEAVGVICPTLEAKYFCADGWTIDSALIGLTKLDFWRKAFSVMPGLGPGIHVVIPIEQEETWMAGSSPATTSQPRPLNLVDVVDIRRSDEGQVMFPKI